MFTFIKHIVLKSQVMKKINWLLIFTFLFSNALKAQQTDTYEDMRNGQVYKTVEIGTQLWLAENLSVTKFNDDSAIPYVDNLETWENIKTPAYCWYNNDINNKDTYGALYNYYVAIDKRNICPTRFHLPTEEDWKVLENYLSKHFNLGINRYGKPSIAKSMASTSGWKINSYYDAPFGVYNDQASNNKSGFNAVPSGVLHESFVFLGSTTTWWASTKDKLDSRYLMTATLQNIWAHLNISAGPPKDGNSIRCVAY